MDTKTLTTHSLLLSRETAAAMLSVCTRTIDAMIAGGRLSAISIGRRRLISRSQLESISTGNRITTAGSSVEGKPFV